MPSLHLLNSDTAVLEFKRCSTERDSRPSRWIQWLATAVLGTDSVRPLRGQWPCDHLPHPDVPGSDPAVDVGGGDAGAALPAL